MVEVDVSNVVKFVLITFINACYKTDEFSTGHNYKTCSFTEGNSSCIQILKIIVWHDNI